MLKSEFTGQFKKDYKQTVKWGCSIPKLQKAIELLCAEHPLPLISVITSRKENIHSSEDKV